MSDLPSELTPDEFADESQDEAQEHSVLEELSPELQRKVEANQILLPDVPDEQNLDLGLLKQVSSRRIQKFGTVQFFKEIYQGDCLLDLQVNMVNLRYDPGNIVHIFAYTQEKVDTPSQFLGVLRIRFVKEEKLSLIDLRLAQRSIREGFKEIKPSRK